MSNLPAQLSAQLRCPITASPLIQHGSTLVSSGTGAHGETYSYRIVEGIPVLLAEEATLIPHRQR
ncbi:Trm112 family protein [Paeniglutamicibacter gangotriensis]|uniref:Trm112 family protein n=1 Tax=Paeniglutamicibacter gangotriensis TaxID=254787 RepID=UPI0037C9A48F